MVLIESTFLGCLFARDGDKSHQKNRKIQIWKWDIEMETLNSSGDIIEVPHANQTSSFALHYGLLIVIPHATKDVQRRAAQRETWQMLLLERSGVGSDGDEASRFGDMVFSELHRSRKEDSTEHSCSSKDV